MNPKWSLAAELRVCFLDFENNPRCLGKGELQPLLLPPCLSDPSLPRYAIDLHKDVPAELCNDGSGDQDDDNGGGSWRLGSDTL
jgi:hypothetical protein